MFKTSRSFFVLPTLLLASLPAIVLAAGKAPKDEPRAAFARPSKMPDSAKGDTAEMITLGKMLFFDPRVSLSKSQSCVSCHHPGMAWELGLPKAIGHASQEMPRKAQTLYNLAWNDSFFWDGRSNSLEEQALTAMSGAKAMNISHEELEKRFRAIKSYEPYFKAAFPSEGVTRKTIVRAIAAYERTIVSGETPFDRWIQGDAKAISPEAVKGFQLFNGKARCVKCHAGWNFTDQGFHDIGLKSPDIGRGKALPNIVAMKHAFKTPTLRGIASRAPYFHDGSQQSLEGVIELYNHGGDEKRPSLSPEIRDLGLAPSEISELAEFLRTLSSQDAPTAFPVIPRD